MRIVTRPDFDGVVCAVLLLEAEDVSEPVFWTEPGLMQRGVVEVKPGDIIANLPYHDTCSLWFDHHYTNRVPDDVKGAFRIAPSAAGVIFDYYRERFETDFSELVFQADKIDSADLSRHEVECPEAYPHVLLSMTISGRNAGDEPYWNLVTDLLGGGDIDRVMIHPEVKKRCDETVQNNRELRRHLEDHTTMVGQVAVTDFRGFAQAPEGNRFLVYSLFEDAVVCVKIRYDNRDRQKVILSVGHSIFNKNCHVNAGLLLSRYNGGGHFGAAACSFHVEKADTYIPEIIAALEKNIPLE